MVMRTSPIGVDDYRDKIVTVDFCGSFIGVASDGDPTSQLKDTLCDIGGPMTRSKTKRMKQILQRPNYGGQRKFDSAH